MSKWIRKGDKVVVIAGNEKGKTGVVLSRGQDRVVVQGVNLRKKHLKQRSETAPAQILDMESPLHISNVAFCDHEERPVRVSVRYNDQKEKELVYKKGGKLELLRSIKRNVG